MPGVDKTNIHVTFDSNEISINWLARNGVKRSNSVGAGNVNNIKAKLKDGMLYVTFDRPDSKRKIDIIVE